MSRKPPQPLPDTDDPYVLLDVRPGASADQIRRAYLRRVKVYKPDRHPAQFRRIREAYDRLREQEAWFDAWRQANDLVRQAQQAQARGEGDDPAPPDDEPTDEALRAEALADAEEDDERPIEQIVAELEDELRRENGVEAARAGAEDEDADAGEGADAGESSWSAADAGGEASWEDADAGASEATWEDADAVADEGEDEGDQVAPREPAARLAALATAVHEDLMAGRHAEAGARLLAREVLVLASRPEFPPLLLEACCALVWAAPSQFDALMTRYGDLVTSLDTEYRDGALLHRRTLADEVAGWREEVARWPQLDRFVMLGASLRAPAEAELGLHLGQRAAADPAGFLEVIARATMRAPGIAALYVGMAERWARHYGRLPPRAAERTLPSVEQAAAALAHTAQHHRWVRWEQVRPLLVMGLMITIVVGTSSRVVELVTIGLMLVLWAWRAWAARPEERIYVRALRPAAAAWLWATRASPDELAVALAARLPRPGTWAAVLHPGDPSDYPHLLGNDLALLAFSVTAPMIPRLGGSGSGSGSGPGSGSGSSSGS